MKQSKLMKQDNVKLMKQDNVHNTNQGSDNRINIGITVRYSDDSFNQTPTALKKFEQLILNESVKKYLNSFSISVTCKTRK